MVGQVRWVTPTSKNRIKVTYTMDRNGSKGREAAMIDLNMFIFRAVYLKSTWTCISEVTG